MTCTTTAFLALIGLTAAVYGAPLRPPTTTDGDDAVIECRLKLIAMDIGTHEYDTTGPFNHSSPTWMCCDPADDLNAPEDDCTLLYGAELARLRIVDSGQVVRLRNLNHGAGAAARGEDEIPALTRKAFGDEKRAKYRPTFVELPNKRVAFGRNLLDSGGGAQWIDRSFAHGRRSILSVVVGSADPGNGDVAGWGTKGCSLAEVRKEIIGQPDGVTLAMDASQWARRTKCKTEPGKCKWNLCDHIRHLSRNQVIAIPLRSKELYLPTVPNWPADYCSWRDIWSAIRAAILADGRFNINDFDHVIAFVPKHCSIGVGALLLLPGARALRAGMCTRRSASPRSRSPRAANHPVRRAQATFPANSPS